MTGPLDARGGITAPTVSSTTINATNVTATNQVQGATVVGTTSVSAPLVSATLFTGANASIGNLGVVNGAINYLATQRAIVGFDGLYVVGPSVMTGSVDARGGITAPNATITNIGCTNLVASNQVQGATLVGTTSVTAPAIVGTTSVTAPTVTGTVSVSGGSLLCPNPLGGSPFQTSWEGVNCVGRVGPGAANIIWSIVPV
jgi:hypothetical protein